MHLIEPGQMARNEAAWMAEVIQRAGYLKKVCAFSAFIERDCHAVPSCWVEMLIMFAKPP